MPAKKQANDLKDGTIHARLRANEKYEFIQYCEKHDVKYGRLLRKIVREIIAKQPDLITSEMKEFKGAVKQLAGISRNLNQLTRAVNSGKYPKRLTEESYFIDLKAYVKDVRKQLDAVIDMTENRWIEK